MRKNCFFSLYIHLPGSANYSGISGGIPRLKDQVIARAEHHTRPLIDMIERNFFDLIIFFYNPLVNSPNEANIFAITRVCDRYNIPIATNIATAESMVLGLANGDLDWRENMHPIY